MFPWTSVGEFRLPTFLLIQILNACLLLWWAFRRARAQGKEARIALDGALIALVTGLIGARLLHVAWEAPDYYRVEPARVFDLLSGGYVYYGGFLFAFAAGTLFLRAKKEPVAPWLDFSTPVLSLGTAIGRLGCLFGGCCYGKICYQPWAVSIVDEKGAYLPRHPAPLYAILWELATLTILLALEKDRARGNTGLLRRPGSLFALWMILHGIGRFLIEFIRDDFRGSDLVGLSLSQWLSLGLVAVGGAVLARASKMRSA